MKINPMDRVIIYRESGSGRMYLCADGSLCSDRDQASEHWASQFDAIISENPILIGVNFEPGMEVVGDWGKQFIP